jgi:hypothetical protein
MRLAILFAAALSGPAHSGETVQHRHEHHLSADAKKTIDDAMNAISAAAKQLTAALDGHDPLPLKYVSRLEAELAQLKGDDRRLLRSFARVYTRYGKYTAIVLTDERKAEFAFYNDEPGTASHKWKGRWNGTFFELETFPQGGEKPQDLGKAFPIWNSQGQLEKIQFSPADKTVWEATPKP